MFKYLRQGWSIDAYLISCQPPASQYYEGHWGTNLEYSNLNELRADCAVTQLVSGIC
jgi:hypothetical protein